MEWQQLTEEVTWLTIVERNIQLASLEHYNQLQTFDTRENNTVVPEGIHTGEA